MTKATHTIAITAEGVLFAEVEIGGDISAEIISEAAKIGDDAPACDTYDVFWAPEFDDQADAFRDANTIVYRADHRGTRCAVLAA